MENNNRQGCRWVKAIQDRIDYLKKADAEVCEKRWGNITPALERMVARETSNFLTERRHELEELLRTMESINENTFLECENKKLKGLLHKMFDTDFKSDQLDAAVAWNEFKQQHNIK